MQDKLALLIAMIGDAQRNVLITIGKIKYQRNISNDEIHNGMLNRDMANNFIFLSSYFIKQKGAI